MAAAYDIPVIPHGSSVFSYHMQYAFSNCPIAEFLVMSPKADQLVPLFGELFTNEPLPKDGYIDLSDEPGWGVELNDQLELVRPYQSRREVVVL
jgi:L-rhamnonate dehydratase